MGGLVGRAVMLVALSLATACIGGDDGEGDGEGTWTLVFEELDAALISVAGSAADDVWAVGADTGDGQGALVLHFDGAGWRRVESGVEADLWWVHVADDGQVFMSGSEGTIVRGESGDQGALEAMSTPGSATVYGIWGTRSDDLFAVGGNPDETPGFVWHFDGDAWTDRTAELPEEVPPLFKVWGRAQDDVWMVGMDGVAVHWDGSAFALAESDTTRRLFTVHGTASGEPAYVAVGGFGSAVIVEHHGEGWHDATPEAAPQLFGVHMSDGERGYAVGVEGSVLRRDASGWHPERTGVELFNPFHAVWVDPDGGVWAVGGDVLTPLLDDGMLLHKGREIPDAIEP